MSRFKYLLAVPFFFWGAAGFAPVKGTLLGVDLVPAAHAQSQQAATQLVPKGTREVPARTIPVPDTVSPQM